MPIFKKNDIEINYIKEGSGKPLVLVHDFGTKLGGWDFQIQFFKQKMTVIALDNRGVGKSSRPNFPYSMDMFVEDLKDLLDYLNIQEKIHLCGISMGGMIVQNFLLKYPDMVKTLTLCATSAYIESNVLNEFVNQIKRLERINLEKRVLQIIPILFSRAFRKKLNEDQSLVDSLKNDTVFITPIIDPTRGQDYDNHGAAMLGHDTRDSLNRIKQPSLIMVGTRDRIIPLINSEFMHQRIPNSLLKVFKNLGHAFTIEEPDKVNKMMWNFIKEHLG